MPSARLFRLTARFFKEIRYLKGLSVNLLSRRRLEVTWCISVLCQGGRYAKTPTFPGVVFLQSKLTWMALLFKEEFSQGTSDLLMSSSSLSPLSV